MKTQGVTFDNIVSKTISLHEQANIFIGQIITLDAGIIAFHVLDVFLVTRHGEGVIGYSGFD